MAEFEIHRKFAPLLKLINGDPKYKNIDTVIISGGRGSFKSYTTAGLLSIALVHRNWKILYTRYVMSAAQDSVISEVSEKIDMFDFREQVKQTSNRIVKTAEIINDDTELDYNTPAIVFKGIKTSSGNQTANLKSLKGFNCFVLDEAEEHKNYSDFRKIQRSLRRKDLQNISILVFNPTSKTHWIYQEFYEKYGLKGGENCIVDNIMYIHMVYTDMLRFVSDNNLRDFERTKINDPDDYQHNILGAFRERAEGVIFTNWEYGEFDDSLPYCYGLDFGVRDADALIRIAVCKSSRKIYVEELMYATGQNTDILIQVLRNRMKNPKDLIVADSQALRTINDLRKNDFNILGIKKPQIKDRIRQVGSFKIIVCGKSPNLVRELNNYAWADKGAEIPVDKYNHLMDAKGYAFTFLTKGTVD